MDAIQSEKNTRAYTVILVGLTGAVGIVVIGVVVYAKVSSAAASTIVVKEVPEQVACQPEFEEMDLDV